MFNGPVHPGSAGGRRGFTLIELLVVVAVIAALIGVLLPSLAGAREAGRSAVCLSNLRQQYLACRMYADANEGYGPAIGQPYAALPNWALVVQTYGEREGSTPGELYTDESVLVCPTVRAFYGRNMQRTYAMNATGHAGQPGPPPDPDDYDDASNPGRIRFDRVDRPSDTPLLLDSAVTVVASNAPPPTRTASMLDFRQPGHVEERLGRFHARLSRFNTGHFDGSAGSRDRVMEHWVKPLP